MIIWLRKNEWRTGMLLVSFPGKKTWSRWTPFSKLFGRFGRTLPGLRGKYSGTAWINGGAWREFFLGGNLSHMMEWIYPTCFFLGDMEYLTMIQQFKGLLMVSF